jgi:hypothetical protein
MSFFMAVKAIECHKNHEMPQKAIKCYQNALNKDMLQMPKSPKKP